MRRPILLVLLFALLAGVAGCGGDDTSEPGADWHPVTTEESQLLAATRFNNFDAGTRSFQTQVTVQGSDLKLAGWVDFVEHVGYARVTGETFDPQTLVWGTDSIALRGGDPGFEQPTRIAEPTEADGWQIRALDASSSPLDALLALIGQLGTDRPENPLLLQQAGALWLRTDHLEVDGTSVKVSVFAAPPGEEALGPDDPAPTPESATVRLWVDADGMTHRVEALLGDQWVNVDLGPATGESMRITSK